MKIILHFAIRVECSAGLRWAANSSIVLLNHFFSHQIEWLCVYWIILCVISHFIGTLWSGLDFKKNWIFRRKNLRFQDNSPPLQSGWHVVPAIWIGNMRLILLNMNSINAVHISEFLFSPSLCVQLVLEWQVGHFACWILFIYFRFFYHKCLNAIEGITGLNTENSAFTRNCSYTQRLKHCQGFF